MACKRPDLPGSIQIGTPMYSILCKKKHTKSPTFLISQRETFFLFLSSRKSFSLQESKPESSRREYFGVWTSLNSESLNVASLNTSSLNAPNAEIFRSSTDTEERRLKFRLWTAQQHSICKSQDFGFSWLYAMIRWCDAAEMAGEIRKFEEWSEIFVSLVASNLAETS